MMAYKDSKWQNEISQSGMWLPIKSYDECAFEMQSMGPLHACHGSYNHTSVDDQILRQSLKLWCLDRSSLGMEPPTCSQFLGPWLGHGSNTFCRSPSFPCGFDTLTSPKWSMWSHGSRCRHWPQWNGGAASGGGAIWNAPIGTQV